MNVKGGVQVLILWMLILTKVEAGEIRNAQIRIVLDDIGVSLVTAIYNISEIRDLVQLPIKGLLHQDAKLQNIQVRLGNGQYQSFEFGTSDSPLLAGQVHLDRSEIYDSDLRVELTYEVMPHKRKAKYVQYIIPVLYPDLPAASSSQGIFQASIDASEVSQLREFFPAVKWKVTGIAGRNIYESSLQALISVIQFKSIPRGNRFISFSQTIDGIVILVLLVIIGIAWRKMIKQKTGIKTDE